MKLIIHLLLIMVLLMALGVLAGPSLSANGPDRVGDNLRWGHSTDGIQMSLSSGITGTVSKPSLWPPNHKMEEVTVNYAVTSCSSCALSVSSNEPVDGTGDGDTAPDWEVVNNHLVRLRAERSGSGDGRVYTITITCLNGLNSEVQTVQVVVPHDKK